MRGSVKQELKIAEWASP